MDDKGLTIKKAAEYINEKPSTLRNWTRELGPYMKIKKGDNGYRYFDDEALETLTTIKSYIRDQHYTVKQVEYFLSTGKQPGEHKVSQNPKQSIGETDILNVLHKMNNDINRLEQNQKTILEKLRNNDNERWEKIEKAKKETENKKKQGFFKRFFG